MQQLSLFDLPPPPTCAPPPIARPPEPRVIATVPAPDDPAPLLRAGWRQLGGLVWEVRDVGDVYHVTFADESEVAAACALLVHDPTITLRDLLEALGAEEDGDA